MVLSLSGRLAASSAGLALAALFLPTPAAAAPSNYYTALGDSYSSGVGAREYYTGGCQRSPKAYPVLVADRTGRPLTFVACGGATTRSVLSTQTKHVTADTRYVTISVGGNDAGFSKIVAQCAKPWPTTCWGDIDKAEEFVRKDLPAKLDKVYTEIRTRAARNVKVVVLGYPRLFNGRECNFATRISADEQKRMNRAADLLVDTIKARTQAARFTFVEARKAFTGHAICDKEEWINGLSKPTGESYHPNVKGYQAFADLVEPALR